MKQLLRKYLFDYWWFPVLLFLVVGFTSLLLSGVRKNFLINFIDLFFIATIVLLFIAAFWQLTKGKWYFGLLQFAILGIGSIVIFLMMAFASIFTPDTFADDLVLPENVELHYPIETEFNGNALDSSVQEVADSTLELYNSFQPGLYEYTFWLTTSKSGTVYLKAYEITQERALSEPRLREKSSMQIPFTNGKLIQFTSKSYFTIYEGEWGKPYAARFEVWFAPDDGTAESKLLEKNFVIEGWMR